MKKKKLRPLGEVLLDLEPLICEMAVEHGLQWGDILGNVFLYMMVHLPSAREEYLDGSHPEFSYAPRKHK